MTYLKYNLPKSNPIVKGVMKLRFARRNRLMMHPHPQGGKFFDDMQLDHHPVNFHEVQICYHSFFR